MPRALEPCGTVGAYHRHRYHGEPPCEPCKRAYSKRSANRWYNNPGERESGKWRMRTRNKALRTLAERHWPEALILKGELSYSENRTTHIREELRRRYPNEFQSILLTIRREGKMADG